jgi:hypothetical protein
MTEQEIGEAMKDVSPPVVVQPCPHTDIDGSEWVLIGRDKQAVAYLSDIYEPQARLIAHAVNALAESTNKDTTP